ncbi:MAG: rhomboid family intramembrane serine protease [Pseudomonadota bacterium]|nr:rhomboid family intramembrane serine protease [Pseudomonadota bacterium]
MNDILAAFKELVAAMQENMLFILSAIGIMWLINFVNWWILGSRLFILGIFPRRLPGLIGIPCAPILHGNFNHLFFNSFPLFVLANMVLLKGFPIFFAVTAIVVFLSGIITWLIGRRAFHLGASSLIMGYWSYLLIQAYYERTAMALILGAVSLYYFGGLLLSLFPDERGVSWEGHLSGFLGGIAAFYILQYPF